jgi:hypothetical protein
MFWLSQNSMNHGHGLSGVKGRTSEGMCFPCGKRGPEQLPPLALGGAIMLSLVLAH